MATSVEMAILRTVNWFSLFEYPPTSFEIWKWLRTDETPPSLGSVVDQLSTSVFLEKHLQQNSGTYQLKNTPVDLSVGRQERYVDALRKRRRVERALRYLRLIPTVRGVAICNTLAWMHTRGESDIDLFVIARDGTIWLTRLLLVLPMKLFGLRPGERVLDPFCLSFFVSDAALDLRDVALPEGDPYLAQWVMSLHPVFDRGQVFSDFFARNTWATAELKAVYPKTVHAKKVGRGFSWSFFERVAEWGQRKWLSSEVRALAGEDTRVVLSSTRLKFHTRDRRAWYRDEQASFCESEHL